MWTSWKRRDPWRKRGGCLWRWSLPISHTVCPALLAIFLGPFSTIRGRQLTRDSGVTKPQAVHSYRPCSGLSEGQESKQKVNVCQQGVQFWGLCPGSENIIGWLFGSSDSRWPVRGVFNFIQFYFGVGCLSVPADWQQSDVCPER